MQLKHTFLSFLLLCSGAVFADSTVIAAYEEALRRFEAGELDVALIQVRNTLQRQPGHLPAKVLLGRIRMKLGHPKAAEEALEQARQLGASSSLVAVPLARARNQLGRYRLNTETIDAVALSSEVAGDLLVELGNAWLALGQLIDARISFERAIALAPENVGGALGLVSVNLEEGKPDVAEAMCRQVIEVEPENADAWFILGVLRESQSAVAEAETHFKRALEFDPYHAKAQLAHAVVVLNRDRPAEAVPLFDAILRKRPWSLEATYLRSQALAAAGRGAEAEDALRAAAKLVATVTPGDLSGNPRLLLISSLVLYDADQLDNAVVYLNRYLQIRPGDVQARKQAAKLSALLGKPQDAIRKLRSLAAERPRDAQVQVMLGDVYAEMLDFIQAERYYRSAIQMAVPNLRLVSRLGFAQYGRGRTDLAIDTMRRLVDMAPGRSAGASIFLGILYLHIGEYELAREVAEEVASQMPDNLLAINLKAVIAVAQKKYVEGRSLFNSVLVRDPSFDPARINLIKLDIVEKKFDAARQTLDELAALDPTDKAVLRTYAELSIALNEYVQAVEYLERVLTLDRYAVPDAVLLSRVLEVLGESQEALSLLLSMSDALPEDIGLKQRLAEVFIARDNPAAAQSVLVDAATLAGSNVIQRVAIAELQVKAGAYDDAMQGMQRALGERPNAPEPLLIMAEVHALQNRLLQADDMASRLVDIYPKNNKALSLLGDIRMSRGQYRDAAELYGRSQALEDKPVLAVSRYRAMSAAGQRDAAVRELEAWHRSHDENALVMRVLADRYAAGGRVDEAIELYRRVIEIRPADVTAHNNLAVAVLPQDAEEALKAAQRAYQLAPANPAVLDTLGWIQVQLGDLEAGLSLLREALTRDENVPEIRYHLAVALEEFGSPGAARRELRRALTTSQPFSGREDAERRLERLESE